MHGIGCLQRGRLVLEMEMFIRLDVSIGAHFHTGQIRYD